MIDFIDFGCGEGGSIEYAKIFGGITHLGIEQRKESAEKAKERYHVINCDILNTPAEELPKCRYVTMLHFLEHLKDLKEVRRAIELASSVATDFVFIKMPFFDGDDYLKEKGFKLTWSDWTGHPCSLCSWHLDLILNDMRLKHHIFFHQKIKGSWSNEVLPYDAPKDTIYFSDLSGLEKKNVAFKGIYREMVCYVKLSDIDYWDELIKTKL